MNDMLDLFGVTTAWLLWGIVFSALGLGYFVYGKRQKNPVILWTGVGLMVYPCFVGNTYVLVGVGIALTALPFIFRPRD